MRGHHARGKLNAGIRGGRSSMARGGFGGEGVRCVVLGLLASRPGVLGWPDAVPELPAYLLSLGQSTAVGTIAIAALHLVLAALYCPTCVTPARRAGA